MEQICTVGKIYTFLWLHRQGKYTSYFSYPKMVHIRGIQVHIKLKCKYIYVPLHMQISWFLQKSFGQRFHTKMLRIYVQKLLSITYRVLTRKTYLYFSNYDSESKPCQAY